MKNLTLVHHLHSSCLILGQPFQSIAGWRIHGGLWAMWLEMWLLFLDWRLWLLISTIGLFGLFIGLLRALCSGLSLFLAMTGITSLSLSLSLLFLICELKTTLLIVGLCSGHGSFSSNPKLNSVAGHLLHSSILVPYHGWYVYMSPDFCWMISNPSVFCF